MSFKPTHPGAMTGLAQLRITSSSGLEFQQLQLVTHIVIAVSGMFFACTGIQTAWTL